MQLSWVPKLSKYHVFAPKKSKIGSKYIFGATNCQKSMISGAKNRQIAPGESLCIPIRKLNFEQLPLNIFINIKMFIIITLPRTLLYGNEHRLCLFGIKRFNDGVKAVNKTLISAVILFSNVIFSKQLRPFGILAFFDIFFWFLKSK